MTRIPTILVTTAMALVLASGQAMANGRQAIVETAIDVSFVGLPMGTLRNIYTVSADRYTINGWMKSNPLVSIVAGATASFANSGRFSGTQPVPSEQKVSYTFRRRKGAVSLAFSGGNVRSAVVSPKKKIKPGTVPLKSNHKLGVIDPVSALVISVAPKDIGNGNKICNRTLPVFDGASRYNLKLSFRTRQTAQINGFRGDVFTCNVRYQPIAGHRPKKKDVRYLKANRNMQVTMARIGETNSCGLFGFSVKTRNCTAVGRARTFASR